MEDAKARIDRDGTLLLQRKPRLPFSRQLCPFSKEACGDYCPLFLERVRTENERKGMVDVTLACASKAIGIANFSAVTITYAIEKDERNG